MNLNYQLTEDALNRIIAHSQTLKGMFVKHMCCGKRVKLDLNDKMLSRSPLALKRQLKWKLFSF